jgi:hypothetical protein
MNAFFTCYIEYRLNGVTRIKQYRARDPGEAFHKCHRRFPDAELLGGWRLSERNGERAITYYEAPSTISITATPEIVWEQTAFGFADQLSFKPKESSRHWDVPAS